MRILPGTSANFHPGSYVSCGYLPLRRSPASSYRGAALHGALPRRLAGFLILLSLLLAGCAGGQGQATAPPETTAPAEVRPTSGPTEAEPVQSPVPPPAEPTQGAALAEEATPTRLPLIATPVPPTPVTALSPDTFQNPVFRINFPDPFLLKEGDTWYAYATNGAGRNIQLATSTDLVKWQLQPDAMPTLASWIQFSSSDVWAPEAMKNGDQYVLYYTARDKASGKQCVGAAVSSEPQGKFRDPHDAPLVCQSEEGGTIDASPFRDGDKLYLLFKNDGNCCGFPTYIYVQELAPDGLSLVGEPTRLVRNDEGWEGHVIEAPTMVVREEKYYLFYSANDYGGHLYAVGYATCETATGPCQDAPENPILASRMQERPLVVGPGHQTVITVNGQDWLVYHAWNILTSGVRSDSRFMWLDRLEWVDGKPDVLGPTTDPQPEP